MTFRGAIAGWLLVIIPMGLLMILVDSLIPNLPPYLKLLVGLCIAVTWLGFFFSSGLLFGMFDRLAGVKDQKVK